MVEHPGTLNRSLARSFFRYETLETSIRELETRKA